MAKPKTEKNISIKTKNSDALSTKEYSDTLADLKNRIRDAQIRAANAANRELLKL